MKHEIFTIKCCDSIAPYRDWGKQYNDKNDCLPRSVTVSSIIESDINFGMVFYYNPLFANRFKDSISGWNFNYFYHLWTEKDGIIYDSCRQWKKNYQYELLTGELAMMFDISHFENPKTLAQFKMLNKQVKKRLNYAQSKGVKYVYLCGKGWDLQEGPWYTWDWVNSEIDAIEERFCKSNMFS